MGHSCGGLQAIRVSADPRVSTSMIFNSGVLNGGPASGRSGIQVTKDELSKLHAPVAYITGGPTDIAHPNAVDDVSRIDGPPLFFAYNGIGHGGTFRVAPNGGDYLCGDRSGLVVVAAQRRHRGQPYVHRPRLHALCRP